MGQPFPRRLWGDAYALSDLLEQAGGGHDYAVRDFALLTIAAQLTEKFPGQLVFKGGFVLRHVHQVERFSEDVDATRHNPAKHRLDAAEVADAIRDASAGDIIRFAPQQPAIDSARSLDFDQVLVTGSLMQDTQVQVEISYREEVVDPPMTELVGAPYYENFAIQAMSPVEMAAEKMRTLAQRVKVTDLADLAELLVRDDVLDSELARLAQHKFQLVSAGVANREMRILEHLREMTADYDATVRIFYPAARSYAESFSIVWPRIKRLIP
jgi:predicted nucleotidyltransferase component of viral defense system